MLHGKEMRILVITCEFWCKYITNFASIQEKKKKSAQSGFLAKKIRRQNAIFRLKKL